MGVQSNGREFSLDYRADVYHGQLNRLVSSAASAQTMTSYLAQHALTVEMAAEYRLGYVENPAPQDKRFKGMLCVPYLTRAGVKALKFRCMADHDHSAHGGKYAQPAGQLVRPFNPEAYFKAYNTIGLCEGEIDAIVATEALGVPTVGVPGVEMWRSHVEWWRHTLKDYDEVIVFGDGDDAGRRMARQVQEDLGTRALIAQCDTGEDIASTVAAGKADALREKAGL
jgi:DNA primase